MSASLPARRSRTAELVAALSLATDLGNGYPLEKTLRTCLLALRIAERLGLSPAEQADVYYLTLLRSIACTSYAHEEANLLGGDDIAANLLYGAADSASLMEMGWRSIGSLASGVGPVMRARAVVNVTLFAKRIGDEMCLAHFDVGARLAARLGMGDAVKTGLGQVWERWDGRGMPNRIGGDELGVATRIMHVAFVAEVEFRAGGYNSAAAEVRRRSGGHFDPRIAAAFTSVARTMPDQESQPSLWDEVLAAEPPPHQFIHAAGLAEVAGVFAAFADLKSPFTLGHSMGVAALAGRATQLMGRNDADVNSMNLAGLFHDLGRVSVPSGIWDKRGALSAAEWERVRLHSYYTERILTYSPLLAPIARLAGMHHERLDGSGYPHQSAAGTIPAMARLLAAADAYQARTEERPHRVARTPSEAAGELQGEVRAGHLDREAAAAVIAAAGQVPSHQWKPWPAGLTEREVDVLRLVSRAQGTRQIARALFISESTARHHIEHIYEKIGVSSRAGAALFAIEHDLIQTVYT
jgi:HD-GYP domain-containing protein (c-di-GMP phosphodiesterase class II)/DNA-binding CsgD family transcriptional regulator